MILADVSENAFLISTFYSVMISDSGEIIDVNNSSSTTYSNEDLSDIAVSLIAKGKTQVMPVMEIVNFSRSVMGELLLFESSVFEKGLELNFDSVKENVYVHGNAEQLGRLVSILLDNAIEHSTENGRVTVVLTEKHKKAHLSVTNEGKEIPKEQQDLIFERFYRTDFARSVDGNHYGLGLAIAKSIVEVHHGDISVSCKNGLVTFSVSLPIIND